VRPAPKLRPRHFSRAPRRCKHATPAAPRSPIESAISQHARLDGQESNGRSRVAGSRLGSTGLPTRPGVSPQPDQLRARQPERQGRRRPPARSAKQPRFRRHTHLVERPLSNKPATSHWLQSTRENKPTRSRAPPVPQFGAQQASRRFVRSRLVCDARVQSIAEH
jgi:hypothetical protein